MTMDQELQTRPGLAFFTARVPVELHAEIRRLALRRGTSLNKELLAALEAHLAAARALEERTVVR